MGDDYQPRELMMWYPRRNMLCRIDWNNIVIFPEGWMATLFTFKQKAFPHCEWIKTLPYQTTNCTFSEMIGRVIKDCPYIDSIDFNRLTKIDMKVKNIMIEL